MKYSFRKYQPFTLRLWHWLNALVILGLLSTVLLRKTFLSWRTNSVLIEEKLKQAGSAVTPELAKDIAVAIRNPMWDWHIYFGLTLAVLLLGRIAIALIVEKKCPGVHALKSLMSLSSVPAAEKSEALHHTLVKIGYAVFYLSVLTMVLTGLMMNYKNELSLQKDFVGTIKEVHEIMQWFFIVFVAGHLVGLVIAENTTDPGLVSDMIHGGDPKQK